MGRGDDRRVEFLRVPVRLRKEGAFDKGLLSAVGFEGKAVSEHHVGQSWGETETRVGEKRRPELGRKADQSWGEKETRVGEGKDPECKWRDSTSHGLKAGFESR